MLDTKKKLKNVIKLSLKDLYVGQKIKLVLKLRLK